MKKDFETAIKERRSFYAINKEITVTQARIEELVEEAVKYAPSAFNSQSSRVVILFEKNHDQLWDITENSLSKIIPEDQFSPTKEKIDSFRQGYGTIVFYEDSQVIESLQTQFALYKDNFPIWSQQSSGMLQYVVWTLLENEGLGATLQHYNELIDSEVKKTWDIPNNWKIIAQMPFGNPFAAAGDKEFMPIDTRIKIFK